MSGAADLERALGTHPIWAKASLRTRHTLARLARDEQFRPGQLILVAGQPARDIHLLLAGAARVFYPATRGVREVTVKLFWAPAAFGDAESILRTRWAESVQALTPARVAVVNAAAYFTLLRSEPSACFRQYFDVARRFGVAIHSERAANLHELGDRVRALLAAYANHFGKDVPGGRLIDYPFTQDDVATQVGSNRRSVANVLALLYREGLLLRRGRRYLVPSVERLLHVGARRGDAPEAEGPDVGPDLSFRTVDEPWPEKGGA